MGEESFGHEPKCLDRFWQDDVRLVAGCDPQSGIESSAAQKPGRRFDIDWPHTLYPNWTAIGVNWLSGYDFEIKETARIPSRSSASVSRRNPSTLWDMASGGYSQISVAPQRRGRTPRHCWPGKDCGC
jgi:hypothetical protein